MRIAFLAFSCAVMGGLLSTQTRIFAQEASFEPKIGVSFPYQLKPQSTTGDTALTFGLDYHWSNYFGLTQSFAWGVAGENALRYEAGVGFRAFPSYSFNPYLVGGGVYQITPQSDVGLSIRGGVSLDTSRLFDLWYWRINMESGATALFRKPRTLELDLIRIVFAFPF